MAISLSKIAEIPPIDRKMIILVGLSKSISELIPLGYSYWQAVTSMERLMDMGLIARSGRKYLLSESGISTFEAIVAHNKRRKLRPLEEFRIAASSRDDKVHLGRRTTSQIRGRVSS